MIPASVSDVPDGGPRAQVAGVSRSTTMIPVTTIYCDRHGLLRAIDAVDGLRICPALRTPRAGSIEDARVVAYSDDAVR